MKRLIKKLYVIAVLLAFSVELTKAAFTFTFTVQAGTATNIFPSFLNPIKVSQVSLASGASSQAIVQFYDTTTNFPANFQSGVPLWSYTNAPYTNITSYVTNYFTTYTNYYGVVQNSYTNKSLIDVTNSVNTTTNAFPSPLFISAATNATVNYVNLSAIFNSGVWVTNSGTGAGTLVITYQ